MAQETMTKVATKAGERWPAGKRASAGAGVGGVDGGVGEAVEGHGGGAGGEHGDDDPEKLMGGGKAGGGEHGSAEREGERKDGVLPLDHFEGDAEVVQDGHGSRVSVLRTAKRRTVWVCQHSWQITMS